MDMKTAIEVNKWRQSIEPTIKIFRDQLRDQLAPIDSKLEHLKTKVAYLEEAVDKNANKFDTPEGECPTPLKNGVTVPKFIEVQNRDGDYYINIDHIAHIGNELPSGVPMVSVVSSTPEVGSIRIYWETEKEADKCYRRLKRALKE